jgi:hypothetical protein
MTLLKPNMTARYKLPDGTTFEVAFDEIGIPDPATVMPPAPKQADGDSA